MSNVTSLNQLIAMNKTQRDSADTRHIEYQKHQHQIQLVNDIYNGVDTTTQYLFQFPQEIQETFLTRQNRATLRNFVKRAVEAFTGMIFRKSIEVEGYGIRTTRSFKTVDTQQDIKQFTKDITTGATRDGKAYILIDAPQDRSSAPYLVNINRSQLINWRKDNSGVFTMIVIEEVISIPSGTFGTEYVQQWRHYDEFGTISIYQRKSSTSSEIVLVGNPIETDYLGIPLVEVAIDDIPILYDTAKLNIKHFNRLSHKDRYLTMASLPIPVIWGAELDDDDNPTTTKPALVIGVDEAFIFNSKEDGDFQWRELSGNSIDQLEKDLDSITEDITTGILRAADSANTVQKTATEVALLQAEASDRVSAIAISVEMGMKKALAVLSAFNNEKVPEEAKFILSKDFTSALAGTDGQRLVYEAYLMGIISIETFLQSLADAELISMESTTKEIARIKADTFVPVPKVQNSEPKVDKRTASAMKPNDV